MKYILFKPSVISLNIDRMLFAGDVQKTPCPLTIGADPLEKESKYIGYMDDVSVARSWLFLVLLLLLLFAGVCVCVCVCCVCVFGVVCVCVFGLV